MVDVDTFLTTLYVRVDDLCKTSLPPAPHRPLASCACRLHKAPTQESPSGCRGKVGAVLWASTSAWSSS